jgi:hypothetical protein
LDVASYQEEENGRARNNSTAVLPIATETRDTIAITYLVKIQWV